MKNNSKNKISFENLNYIARLDHLPQLIELVKQLEDADKYQYFHQNVDEAGNLINWFEKEFTFLIHEIR